MDMGRHNEIVGSLCRWTLLVLTALALAATSWLGIEGSIGAAAELPRLQLIDTVAQTSPTVRLRGEIESPDGYDAGVSVIGSTPGGASAVGWFNNGRMYLAMPNPTPGLHIVTVTGLPYTSLAMTRSQARLSVVTSGQAKSDGAVATLTHQSR